MKTNSKGIFFASMGALICTALLALAQQAESGQSLDQSQQLQQEQQQQQSSSQEQGSLIFEPSGAERKSYQTSTSTSTRRSFGTLQKGSDIIGMDIRNQQDQKLGSVKELIIDPQSGRVPFAVISTGGLLGLNDRLLVVPPSALAFQTDENALSLNLSQSQLQNAPSFARNQWPDFSNQQWTADVYNFYGQRPYWSSGQKFRSSSTEVYEPSGARIFSPSTSSAVTSSYSTQTRTDYQSDADWLDAEADRKLHLFQRGKGAAEFTHRQLTEKGAPEVIVPLGDLPADSYSQSYSTYETTTPSISAAVPGTTASAYSSSSSTTTGTSVGPNFYRASDLLGMNINNTQGQAVGEIKDFAVDLASGRVAYTVLGSGGFLGVGEKEIAIPLTVFTPGTDAKTLSLNIDTEKLRSAPEFDGSDWESASNQEFVSEVYNYYGQQPYWQAGGFREPSGAEQNWQQNKEDQQQERFDDQLKNEEQGSQLNQQQQQSEEPQDSQISEPAGAQSPGSELKSSEQKSESSELSEPSGEQKGELDLRKEQPERQFDVKSQSDVFKEPSGAESSSTSSAGQTQESKEQSSAPSAGIESSAQQQSSEQQSQSSQSSAEVSEPAGAQSSSTSQSQSTSEAQQKPAYGTQTESSSAEAAKQSSIDQQSQEQSQSAQPSEAQAEQSSQSSAEVSEPAGAQTDVQKIQAALKSDSSLAGAKDIKVTSENGKIVLRGTVKSEAEKQAIEQKIKDFTFENQIQVTGEEDTQSSPTPQSEEVDDSQTDSGQDQ